MVHVKRILVNSAFLKPFHALTRYFFLMGLGYAGVIALSMASCGAAGKKSDASGLDTLIELAEPQAVSAAEMQYYKVACEKWYDTMLRNRGFNGGVIVAKNGNIVFEAYNGTAHLNQSDTITAETAFHIASVSKTFTAMAVLKLWQEGKLGLDDELVKYFPAFNYTGVTIRTLLNHRSGLPNYTHFMEKLKWDKKVFVTNQDIFNILVSRKGELTGIVRPDTKFAYCNTNYALLALLIEKVTGMSYAQFLQQSFFTPLQMQHTSVFDSTQLNTADPSYDWRGTLIPFSFLDLVYGDKNIYTTAHDLLTWDRALSSGKLFADSTLQEAFTPYSNERPGIRNYGLGWRMNVYPNGKKMIFHNGWWHGNNAAFIRLVQDSATIIVVGNKFNRGIYHARDLAPLFGDYGGTMEEEEDVLVNTKKLETPAVPPKKVIKPAKSKAPKAPVNKKQH